MSYYYFEATLLNSDNGSIATTFTVRNTADNQESLSGFSYNARFSSVEQVTQTEVEIETQTETEVEVEVEVEAEVEAGVEVEVEVELEVEVETQASSNSADYTQIPLSQITANSPIWKIFDFGSQAIVNIVAKKFVISSLTFISTLKSVWYKQDFSSEYYQFEADLTNSDESILTSFIVKVQKEGNSLYTYEYTAHLSVADNTETEAKTETETETETEVEVQVETKVEVEIETEVIILPLGIRSHPIDDHVRYIISINISWRLVDPKSLMPSPFTSPNPKAVV